jgi:hypothetical protein
MTHPQTFFSSKCVYFEILNVNKHYIGMEPNSEAFEDTQNVLLLYKGTTIWYWGGAWKILYNRNIYFIFRIKLFIFYIGQIKLFILKFPPHTQFSPFALIDYTTK